LENQQKKFRTKISLKRDLLILIFSYLLPLSDGLKLRVVCHKFKDFHQEYFKTLPGIIGREL